MSIPDTWLGTYSYYFRILNPLALIAFSISALIVHVVDVNVGTVCTDYNIPAMCATKGSGRFRALNFTAPTTSLYFTKFLEPEYSNIPHPDSSLLYNLAYDPNTAEITGDYCTDPSGKKALNSSLKEDADKLDACKAEAIPMLYEIKNGGSYYRISWNLSGGVHIFYFIWLSLWLAASFQVLIFPIWGQNKTNFKPDNQTKDFKTYISNQTGIINKLKVAVLLLWHFVGIIFSLILFTNDKYFETRLPLNNAVLGIIFEGFALLVQLYIQFTNRGHMENSWGLRTKNTFSSSAQANTQGLKNLMTIATPTNTGYTALGRGYANENETDIITHADVFGAKTYNDELLEYFFWECVFTLPLLMVAVFCITSRVNMAWALELLYSRLLLLFLLFGMFFRLTTNQMQMRHNLGKKAEDEPALVRTILMFFGLLLVFLTVTTLLEWIEPIAYSRYQWDESLRFSTWTAGIGSAVLIVIVLALALVAAAYDIWILFFPFNKQTDERDRKMDLGIYMSLSLLVMVVRVIVFAMIVNPGLWYEVYDKNDVLLNYGY